MADVADTELLDYEEEEQTAGGDAAATGDAAAANGTNGAGKLTVQYDLKSDMYYSRNMHDNVQQIQQLSFEIRLFQPRLKERRTPWRGRTSPSTAPDSGTSSSSRRSSGPSSTAASNIRQRVSEWGRSYLSITFSAIICVGWCGLVSISSPFSHFISPIWAMGRN